MAMCARAAPAGGPLPGRGDAVPFGDARRGRRRPRPAAKTTEVQIVEAFEAARTSTRIYYLELAVTALR